MIETPIYDAMTSETGIGVDPLVLAEHQRDDIAATYAQTMYQEVQW